MTSKLLNQDIPTTSKLAYPLLLDSNQQGITFGGLNNGSLSNGAELIQTRMILDSYYAQNWFYGRKMRKQPHHIKKLIDYFNMNPTWDYQTKVKIAEEIGMTFN